MNYEKLNELMKTSKKAEASKSKKKDFMKEMNRLLAEQGFSESAQKYIEEGFTFCGAKPIAQYLKTLNNKERALAMDSLLSTKLFHENHKGIAFKLEVSLLGYALTSLSDDIQLLAKLIVSLPTKAIGKDGHPFKDSARVVKNQFICMINSETNLPPLNDLGVERGFVVAFSKLFSTLIVDIKSTDGIREGIWLKVNDWIGNIDGEDTSKKVLGQNNEQNDQAGKMASREDIDTTRDCVKELHEAVAFVAKKMENLEIEKKLMERRVDASYKECIALKKKIDEITKSLITERENVEKKGNMIKGLEYAILENKAEIKGYKERVLTLEEEMKRRDSIISVYSIDKENAQAEQLNAIASKLKSEYRDFLDARNMEMSIGLGENLRIQLEKVFKELTKAGIDIEKR